MSNLGYGFCPTHPGEILKDEIESRGISQKKLAEQMEMSYSIVNEILNGRRPLTESNAILFEAALGVEADTLMRLQLKYNMQVIRKDEKLIHKFNNILKRKVAAIYCFFFANVLLFFE